MLKTAAMAAAIVLAGVAGGAYWGWADNHASAQSAYQEEYTQPSGSRDSDSSDYYVNSNGHTVHRPMFSATKPDGATAQCSDGSYSFSEHRSGTCSYHGGVSQWFR